MQQLGKVLTQTTWAKASDTINKNSDKIYEAVTQVENATIRNKGYFLSSSELNEAYPNPIAGMTAFVYNQDNDQTYPYDIYQSFYDEETGAWVWCDTSNNAPFPEVDIDSINQAINSLDEQKQDVLGTYNESEYGDVQIIAIEALSMHATYKEAVVGLYADATTGELNVMSQSIEGNTVAALSMDSTQNKITLSSGIANGNNIGVYIDGEQDSVYIQSKDGYGSILVNGAEGSITLDAPEVKVGTTNLYTLIPTGITTAEQQAMQNAGEWETFLENNPLVYIYEE